MTPAYLHHQIPGPGHSPSSWMPCTLLMFCSPVSPLANASAPLASKTASSCRQAAENDDHLHAISLHHLMRSYPQHYIFHHSLSPPSPVISNISYFHFIIALVSVISPTVSLFDCVQRLQFIYLTNLEFISNFLHCLCRSVQL